MRKRFSASSSKSYTVDLLGSCALIRFDSTDLIVAFYAKDRETGVLNRCRLGLFLRWASDLLSPDSKQQNKRESESCPDQLRRRRHALPCWPSPERLDGLATLNPLRLISWISDSIGTSSGQASQSFHPRLAWHVGTRHGNDGDSQQGRSRTVDNHQEVIV